jgi:hypothetical protein
VSKSVKSTSKNARPTSTGVKLRDILVHLLENTTANLIGMTEMAKLAIARAHTIAQKAGEEEDWELYRDALALEMVVTQLKDEIIKARKSFAEGRSELAAYQVVRPIDSTEIVVWPSSKLLMDSNDGDRKQISVSAGRKSASGQAPDE